MPYCFYGEFDYEKENGNWKSCGTEVEIEGRTARGRRQEKKLEVKLEWVMASVMKTE